jgi:hypothetical protein
MTIGPLTAGVRGYHDLTPISGRSTSTVFRAVRTRLNRTVAIKVLLIDVAATPAANPRELETTVLLSSQPHAIRIVDTGVTDANNPYIAMEYCPDGSYADILAQRAPLPIDEVLDVGLSIAEALRAAHTAGIVHGEVKPSNVLRAANGPALADFAMARTRRDGPIADDRIPWHASPEALHTGRSTPASDLYSLASTMWQLLAGWPPFADPAHPVPDLDLLRHRVLTEAPPPVPRPDVPDWLRYELNRALAKDPAARHHSVHAFGEILRHHAVTAQQTPAAQQVPAAQQGPMPQAPGPQFAGPPPVPPVPPVRPAIRWPQGPTLLNEPDPGLPPAPAPAPVPAPPPAPAPAPRPAPAPPPAPTPTAPTKQPDPEPQLPEPPIEPAAGAPQTAQPPHNAQPPANADTPGEASTRENVGTVENTARVAEIGEPPAWTDDPTQDWPTAERPLIVPPAAPIAPVRPAAGWFPDELVAVPSNPPTHEARPTRSDRSRRTWMIVAIVALSILAVNVIIGAVIGLQGKPSRPAGQAAGQPAGHSPTPSTTGTLKETGLAAPRNVVLVDHGGSITLNWTDPTPGVVQFAVLGGQRSAEPKLLKVLAPGTTTLTLQGVNTAADYCYIVMTIQSAEKFARAPQVCTTRFASPPR